MGIVLFLRGRPLDAAYAPDEKVLFVTTEVANPLEEKSYSTHLEAFKITSAPARLKLGLPTSLLEWYKGALGVGSFPFQLYGEPVGIPPYFVSLYSFAAITYDAGTHHLVVADDSNPYLSDSPFQSGRLQINNWLTKERILKREDVKLTDPIAVAYDPSRGLLFVLERKVGRVRTFHTGSGEQTGFTISGLQDPNGLAYDSDTQRLFITELKANRLRTFDARTGQPVSPTIEELVSPLGVAYDSIRQILFVVEGYAGRLRAFSAVDGKPTALPRTAGMEEEGSALPDFVARVDREIRVVLQTVGDMGYSRHVSANQTFRDGREVRLFFLVDADGTGLDNMTGIVRSSRPGSPEVTVKLFLGGREQEQRIPVGDLRYVERMTNVFAYALQQHLRQKGAVGLPHGIDDQRAQARALDVLDDILSQGPAGPDQAGLEESQELLSREGAVRQLKELKVARLVGNFQNGAVVDLRTLPEGVEVLFVSDLHGQLGHLRNILLDDDNLQKIENFERIRQGRLTDSPEIPKAVLVIMGDAVHSETALHMDPSIATVQHIIDLMIRYPHSVYYLLGNHDYLSDKHRIRIPGYKKPVSPWKLYKERLEALYGSEYRELYQEVFLGKSALVALANGVVAVHAGPIKGATLAEIRGVNVLDEENPIVKQATWSRFQTAPLYFNEQDAQDFLAQMGQPNAQLLLGHSHSSDRPWHWQPAPNIHVFYAGFYRPGGGYALARNEMLEFRIPKTDPAAGIEQVDIFSDFKQVEDLGADIPIVFIVKGKDNATYRMQRFTGLRKARKEGFPYGYRAQKRTQVAEGFVAVGPLRQVVVENRPPWRQVGVEPYALATQENQDLAVIGFGRELHLVRISDGELLKRITHPKFAYLHTVEFSKDDPDVVLIASYGTDRILEFNLRTEEVLWEWNPWKLEPYSKNAFGIQIVEKGDPLPQGEGVRILTREEAEARIQRRQTPQEGELPVYVVDFEREQHPLGLEPWELTVKPNWVAYSDTPGKVLATFYFTGQAVEIDKEKGEARVLVGDLENPHGVVPVQDGYLISDTGNGRVLALNKQFQLVKVYDFSTIPIRPGLETRTLNWIQHTYPIGGSLLATVDSKRSAVVVWNPQARIYSIYPYHTEWTVQEVRSLASQRLLAHVGNASGMLEEKPSQPPAGLEERMPGWLRQTVDPDRFLSSVYGVREAAVQQPAAVLFDPDLVPGADDLSRQVLLIELTGQLKAAFAWPESVPFQLGLLSERAGLEEAGFRVIEVLRHPEAKRSSLPISALPLVTAEALSYSQARFYVDPLFYAGLEELRLPEALADLADLFA